MSVATLYEEHINTPLGELLLWTDAQQHIYAVDWSDYQNRMHTLLQRQHPTSSYIIQASAQTTTAYQAIQRYFDGDLLALTALTCVLGGTEFQRQVWRALGTIPCGSTWSYAQLAQAIQRPKAVRAVGAANGANPISLIIPCHRVIGLNQQLTGYAGGLERKRWLLQHENALPTTTLKS